MFRIHTQTCKEGLLNHSQSRDRNSFRTLEVVIHNRGMARTSEFKIPTEEDCEMFANGDKDVLSDCQMLGFYRVR
ncbi:hypothetical protein Y032_0099g3167 [Ancylostoma ceylanicum]|uniref:Uncharacterized protein n=1 Tax=Ancylostoma ceylanicum TaxID=53326 RepID=A0A016TJ08_9BILA|nr:hypothetical protein Y032_0099g3167 [Ancylostoma ceylanicum]